MPTESQNPDRAPVLADYLEGEIRPALEALGFACRGLSAEGRPFLFAERVEDESRPTVLGYGHGDVIRGLDDDWDEGLSPWRLTERGGRWYGRGVADNKGQHSINIGALRAVLETRGRLGFNAKYLIEMGEEIGSPGLRDLAVAHKGAFRADVLIASDGPRLSAERPTIFLGSRGCITFDLWIDARQGGHHSGNWGGLLSDPAIELAHALASIVGPRGEILIPEWRPDRIPDNIRRVLADCDVESGVEGPVIAPDWGEPGLTAAEKVFGWCSFTILAFEAGNPRTPVNAIPPRAWARCQLRFVVGIDAPDVLTSPAAPPRPPPLLDRADSAVGGRGVSCNAAGSGTSLGAVDGRLDRPHHGETSGYPAEPRRRVAERHLRRRSGAADRMGAALLSGVLPARTE